jgi:DNA repair protein RadA/Sms
VAKQRTVFVCQQCGAQFPKWSGQCPDCGAWNSLVEEFFQVKSGGRSSKRPQNFPQALGEVKLKRKPRTSTGSLEFDRVLGGGLVPGSVVLVAGEPGVGKSTLLLQLASQMGDSCGQSVLYVSGEESAEQLKLRAERLETSSKNLFILAETDMDMIGDALTKSTGQKSTDPWLLSIVDSIQAVGTADLSGTPGSVGQVRESALRLHRVAKEKNIPIVIVGQVTKEGSVAGPKVLEHLVDVVLYLEGERFQEIRLLRAMKNRFGSTDEVGVFQMTGEGLVDITNPSEIFLSEKEEKTPGSVVVPTVEGTRPILVEIQALTVSSRLTIPPRVATGISRERLRFLAAVLQKRLGLPLDSQEVYVNVAGGLRVEEPAADLGICLAIYSSVRNKPIKKATAVVGEVGLLGEIRRVSRLDKRINEAQKLGYKEVVGPDKVRTLNEAVKLAFASSK